jgi:hypothetical protein
VYRACRGDIPNGFFIHHVDGNPSNNHIENLSLIESGAHTRHHCSKITRQDAAYIRALADEDEITGRMLASLFSISRWAIYEIWRGRTWTDVPPSSPPSALLEAIPQCS